MESVINLLRAFHTLIVEERTNVSLSLKILMSYKWHI